MYNSKLCCFKEKILVSGNSSEVINVIHHTKFNTDFWKSNKNNLEYHPLGALTSFHSKLKSTCMTYFFYYLVQKSFQSDEEWHLFYCDNTLGCWVIQDFDLCKLENLRCHAVDTKLYKNIFSNRVEILQGWCAARTTHCDSDYDVTIATYSLPDLYFLKWKMPSLVLQSLTDLWCVISIFTHTHWMNFKSK